MRQWSLRRRRVVLVPVHRRRRAVVVTHVPPVLHKALLVRASMRRRRRQRLVGAVASGVWPTQLRKCDVVVLPLHHSVSRLVIYRVRVRLVRRRVWRLVMGVLDGRVSLWLMLPTVVKVLRWRRLMRRELLRRTRWERVGRVCQPSVVVCDRPDRQTPGMSTCGRGVSTRAQSAHSGADTPNRKSTHHSPQVTYLFFPLHPLLFGLTPLFWLEIINVHFKEDRGWGASGDCPQYASDGFRRRSG